MVRLEYRASDGGAALFSFWLRAVALAVEDIDFPMAAVMNELPRLCVPVCFLNVGFAVPPCAFFNLLPAGFQPRPDFARFVVHPTRAL